MIGNFALRPDTWYTVILAVGREGHFTTWIVDPENPKHFYRQDENVPEWAGHHWDFGCGITYGTVSLDDFMTVEFEDFKR